MAVKRTVIETRTSDLSGAESDNVTTVRFAFSDEGEGSLKRYKLDLTPAELATFEGMLTPYMEAANKAKSANGGNTSDDETPAIRSWAQGHGYDVGERGRISPSVKAAYYKAMSEAGNEGTDTAKKETAGKK